MSGGFFRGTSAEQDNRFSNKEKKLLNKLKFEDVLAKKVYSDTDTKTDMTCSHRRTHTRTRTNANTSKHYHSHTRTSTHTYLCTPLTYIHTNINTCT